jgi:glycine/D-amino acid oxidase-like deaminating enzyme/nitrite reductase/ring-hydroxylating ferredoxin subunit
MAELAAPPRSYWIDSAPTPTASAPALPNKVDVAVLGAGIAGLTTAYLLAGRGRSVAVIEARELAAGTSGHTTAKVTAQHGLIYDRLARRFGPDRARWYGESQLAALAWLSAAVRDTGIACDWEDRDSLVYTTRPDGLPALRAEAETAAKLGLPADFTTKVDLPFEVAGAVRFTGQAQFHPRRWLLGLAERIAEAGGSLHPGVRATALDEGDPCRVETTAGALRARDVVVTTHYPVFDRGGYFARLAPLRDLVVAGPVPADSAPPAMYVANDTHHSIRTTPLEDGRRLLVVGGEHYRTGAVSDVTRRYEALAGWARERLGLDEVTHHWSAHDMSTVDGMPYIGRYHPFAKRVWVATGFGAWGMTNGTLTGLILADLIAGTENRWSSLYDPDRFNSASAIGLLRDNAAVAKHFVGDHVESLGGPDVGELAPWQGTVVWRGTRPVAVHRDEDGTLGAVSARCTHLGCLVRWNDAERSWDCPCHGSRFGRDGAVLQGPATHPLARVDL